MAGNGSRLCRVNRAWRDWLGSRAQLSRLVTHGRSPRFDVMGAGSRWVWWGHEPNIRFLTDAMGSAVCDLFSQREVVPVTTLTRIDGRN